MQYLFNKMLSTLHTKEFQKLQNCNFINLVTTHFSLDMNSASKKWILYCWKVNSNSISSVYKVVKKNSNDCNSTGRNLSQGIP